MIGVLLLRRPTGLLAMPLPPHEDALQTATRLAEVIGRPDLTFEWCVVQSTSPRFAGWPDPEPWASPPAAVDGG